MKYLNLSWYEFLSFFLFIISNVITLFIFWGYLFVKWLLEKCQVIKKDSDIYIE